MEKAVCNQVIKDCIITYACNEAKVNVHRAIRVAFPIFFFISLCNPTSLLTQQFLFWFFLHSHWYTLTMNKFILQFKDSCSLGRTSQALWKYG